jgi:hypothetical protein
MIPLMVRFTGLEFDPMEMLQSRQLKDTYIPTEWSRIRFPVDFNADEEKIKQWVDKNTDGKWSIYTFLHNHQNAGLAQTVVVAFELDVDAVMFRLKSGEVAWNEQPTEFEV